MKEEFKALTVLQPWADKIMSGAKSIEVRNNDTQYRGQLIITSNNITICRVELYDVKPIAELTERELYQTGVPKGRWNDLQGYGWFLRKPQRLVPLEVKGRSGMFTLVMNKGELITAQESLQQQMYEKMETYVGCAPIIVMGFAFWGVVAIIIYLYWGQ